MLNCLFENSFNQSIKQVMVLQLLGRSIDLRCLISQRMNKIFRENLEFLFDRFESQDICAIVVSSQLTCYSAFERNQKCDLKLIFVRFLKNFLGAGIGKSHKYLKTFPQAAIRGPDN